MYSFFNSPHWERVRAARRQCGLSAYMTPEPLHPYAHAEIVEHSTGARWRLVSVSRVWQQGYFYIAEARRTDGRSEASRVLIVANENSLAEEVLDALQDFSLRYSPPGQPQVGS